MSEMSEPFHLVLSVLSSSTLMPKTSLLEGLKYFKLPLLNFSPDASAPVHEESLLVLLGEFYPGLQEPCSAGGVGTPCTALLCLGLLVSLRG